MNNKYSPPIAAENQYITLPSTPEEEQLLYEMYRPRVPFFYKILLYVFIWAIIIFACCAIMWNVMIQYESAQPWHTVEEYITSSGQSAFFTAISKAYGENISEYDSLYETAIHVSGRFLGRLSYKKLIREYTYENPVYLIYSGEKNLMKLTLQRGSPTGFMGFIGYTVYNVELIASDLLELQNYAVIYPKGAKVYVNGNVYLPEETDLYAVFGSDEYEVCVLSRMLERPSVRATYLDERYEKNGESEYPLLEGNHFVFDYVTPKFRTITITIPQGATAFIDGKEVPSGFISEEISSADRFGNAYPLVVYTVPTVVGEGEVTAVIGDKQLSTVSSNDGNFVFETLTTSCTVHVPEGATLYANGVHINNAESTETAVWRSDFEGVANAPRANEYTFYGINAIPEFTAKIDETELEMIVDGEKTVFLMPSSNELKDTYTQNVVDFMNAYLYYTTQGYANTRRNLDAVKALVAAPSPLYTNLERSYIGYYYIAPQEMTVEYMEVDNFIPYGEDSFTCELSYKIAFKNWVGEAVDENTMRIAFAKRGNTFLPVNMTLASE